MSDKGQGDLGEAGLDAEVQEEEEAAGVDLHEARMSFPRLVRRQTKNIPPEERTSDDLSIQSEEQVMLYPWQPSTCGNPFPYIQKARVLRVRTPPIFSIFRQNLRSECENHQDFTAPIRLHLLVVFAAWLPHKLFYRTFIETSQCFA